MSCRLVVAWRFLEVGVSSEIAFLRNLHATRLFKTFFMPPAIGGGLGSEKRKWDRKTEFVFVLRSQGGPGSENGKRDQRTVCFPSLVLGRAGVGKRKTGSENTMCQMEFFRNQAGKAAFFVL